MRLKYLLEDKKVLEEKFQFYIKKKQLVKTSAKSLSLPHLEKALHNFKFSNSLDPKFLDWKIVGLYYALYHCALALVTNKDYISKNHSATLVFLIKFYTCFDYEEVYLIEKLMISKDDLQFYAQLKESRHNASYSTNLLFTIDDFNFYKKKTIDFINKTKFVLKYYK